MDKEDLLQQALIYKEVSERHERTMQEVDRRLQEFEKRELERFMTRSELVPLIIKNGIVWGTGGVVIGIILAWLKATLKI